MFRYLIIFAAVAMLGCAAADGAERRIVTRGPLGFRRQVVVDRGPQAVRLPRQSVQFHSGVPILVQPQPLIILR